MISLNDTWHNKTEAFVLKPKVSNLEGSVAIWLDGLPVSAEAESMDICVAEFTSALRDYADLWKKDLRFYPNHESNSDFVRWIESQSNEEIHAYLLSK